MKQFVYFVDDNIWAFRDIKKNNPKSLFDNEYMRLHKCLHEKYGLKVQLNLFYETEGFNLSQMPDKYKDEWDANSDWLKLAFHANKELPDFPYVNATYDEVKHDCERIQNEIIRFAGEKSLSHCLVTHWLTMSKQGVLACKDLGAQLIAATHGDDDESPEVVSGLASEHRNRLFDRGENISKSCVTITPLFGSNMAFLRNYNHISCDIEKLYRGTGKFYKDEETGLYFQSGGALTLNAIKIENIEKSLDTLLGYDYFSILMHEQYFYKDYFAYEANFGEKVEKAVAYLIENGYVSVNFCELIDK